MVGIGVDKDAEPMFEKLISLPAVKLYLTETPFKGIKITDYPQSVRDFSSASSFNPKELLDIIANESGNRDLCVVTGSLYLVGEILKIKSTLT